jgi:lysophospholipase L1-like esterase
MAVAVMASLGRARADGATIATNTVTVPTDPIDALAGSSLARGTVIVFAGDSVTERGDHSGFEDGYVRQVRRALRDKATVYSSGAGGEAAPALEQRIDRDIMSLSPDIVVIYIGLNDAPAIMGDLEGATARRCFTSLENILTNLTRAGITAVLATPTVIGEKKRGENDYDVALDYYAAKGKEIAARCGVPVIDLRDRMVEFLAQNNADNARKGILTEDGVHMNREGNTFIAAEMCRGLQALLQSHKDTLLCSLAPSNAKREFFGKGVVTMSTLSTNTAPNTVIRYTLDGTAPTPVSSAYPRPIPLEKATTVTAAVFVDGKQVGDAVRRDYTKVELLPAEFGLDRAALFEPGIAFARFDNVTEPPEAPEYTFDTNKLVATGTQPDVFITRIVGETFRTDKFGITYEGYLRVENEGFHLIRITMDDGGAMLIGGRAVIALTGNPRVIGRSIPLAAGYHRVRISQYNINWHGGFWFHWLRPGTCEYQFSAAGNWFSRKGH